MTPVTDDKSTDVTTLREAFRAGELYAWWVHCGDGSTDEDPRPPTFEEWLASRGAPVAQGSEQATHNGSGEGSSPSRRTGVDRDTIAALADYMHEGRGPWDDLDPTTYNALYCLLRWFGTPPCNCGTYRISTFGEPDRYETRDPNPDCPEHGQS